MGNCAWCGNQPTGKPLSARLWAYGPMADYCGSECYDNAYDDYYLRTSSAEASREGYEYPTESTEPDTNEP
jgi:hypothetical protein